MKSLTITSLLALTPFGSSSAAKRQQSTYNLDIPGSLQNVLSNPQNNPAYTYPTDLTRDIIPKPIHSHNDYWRDVPFFSALSVGCQSIEADVWLFNETLYVGHEVQALTPERTFDSLYVQPILDVLDRQNPTSQFAQVSTKNGVFDADSSQTLYLFVDVKTDGSNTWPAVVQALKPLRDAGYLTTVNGTAVTSGAVTVIGTGGTPLDQIQGVQNRDFFYDANAALLNSSQSDITSDVSPIASADFSRYIGPIRGSGLNDTQLAALNDQIAVANSRGIGVRYWGTPAWPISRRNTVWQTLVNAGVALLNADDLLSAAGFVDPAPW